MHTDQARRIITLHDNADRALANLRNAGAMSTDDPRAAEMLESAGDAYAESIAALCAEEAEIIGEYRADRQATVVESPGPGQPAPSAPGAEGSPAPSAQVQPEAKRGTNAEARETIPVPKPEVAPDAPSAPEKPAKDSGQGKPPKAA